MSKKTLKTPKPDIEFALNGVEYSLIPMRQKVAAHVFHNCISHVLAAIGQAVSGEDDAERIAKFAAALPKVATFDDIWFILENVMKNAMVNGHEVGDLNDTDIFDENPLHMYMVVYHAIKGNWPNYFSQMETKMAGFVSKVKATLNQVTTGQEEIPGV